MLNMFTTSCLNVIERTPHASSIRGIMYPSKFWIRCHSFGSPGRHTDIESLQSVWIFSSTANTWCGEVHAYPSHTNGTRTYSNRLSTIPNNAMTRVGGTQHTKQIYPLMKETVAPPQETRLGRMNSLLADRNAFRPTVKVCLSGLGKSPI